MGIELTNKLTNKRKTWRFISIFRGMSICNHQGDIWIYLGVPENYEESNPLNYGLRQGFPPHRWVAWSWLRRNLGQRVLMEVPKNLKKMIVWGLLRFLLFRAISEGSNPTNLSMFTMFIRIAGEIIYIVPLTHFNQWMKDDNSNCPQCGTWLQLSLVLTMADALLGANKTLQKAPTIINMASSATDHTQFTTDFPLAGYL